ncbi:hypothetical protein N9004_00445, partial [Pirellulales bacterium]|nr:hypothetical protein [Pirellulales bacterium]
DNDGDVALIEIESEGMPLKKDLTGNLYAGDEALYLSGDTQLTETYFAAYSPVAVEDFGGDDRRLVLENTNGNLLTFSMSATWRRTGNLPWIDLSDPTSFNQAESTYGVDFDNDGDVGVNTVFIEIESDGVKLQKDSEGRLYADNSPLYLSGDTQLTENYFAAYSFAAVEDFGGDDRRLVLENTNGNLLTFSMSATWRRTGNLPWIDLSDPTSFNQAESTYGVDFDNDGDVGL